VRQFPGDIFCLPTFYYLLRLHLLGPLVLLPPYFAAVADNPADAPFAFSIPPAYTIHLDRTPPVTTLTQSAEDIILLTPLQGALLRAPTSVTEHR
jgi:hypothetical protein